MLLTRQGLKLATSLQPFLSTGTAPDVHLGSDASATMKVRAQRRVWMPDTIWFGIA